MATPLRNLQEKPPASEKCAKTKKRFSATSAGDRSIGTTLGPSKTIVHRKCHQSGVGANPRSCGSGQECEIRGCASLVPGSYGAEMLPLSRVAEISVGQPVPRCSR